MENTARLYQCARCHCQVLICSACDRGNIYCSHGCAQQARQASVRAAGARYQRTRQGRFKHADRQRRYRARREKVTHQGSVPPSSGDPLPLRPEVPADTAPIEADAIYCQFCGRRCSPFVRLGYRHRTAGAETTGRHTHHWPRQPQAQAP